MRIRPLIRIHAPIVRSAGMALCMGAVLAGRACAEDEPFAKRFDAGFAQALIHDGVCTVALRQSSFTYATPYDCTTIVNAYHGQPLDALPPEVVVARSLIARIQRDPQALVACYDDASQSAIAGQFADYLGSDRAKEMDSEHVSAALIAGAFVADALYISFRFQDRTGATMFSWNAAIKRNGRGWRLTDEFTLDTFPLTFSDAYATAMNAHGMIAGAELARMSLCRILTTPTIHAQLVQPQDLRQGDLALAVLVSTRDPPLLLDGAVDNASDTGLLALCAASRLYAGAGGDAEIGALWLNDHPGLIHPSPFAGTAGRPQLRFCHGCLPGDSCSIYLLGDGQEAISDIMLGATGSSWKLLNGYLPDSADGGLWRLSLRTHLWSQLAELLRRRGE
jgi:hypothetical protein